MLARLAEMTSCALALGRNPVQQWSIFWRQTKNFRVRVGLGRYHPERVVPLQTRMGTIYLRDNFGDVTNLPDQLQHNVYQLPALSGEGVIFDIGANIGLFAAWAAWKNPGRPLHCFEPLVSNARLISMNCPSAVVHNCAVGRTPARISLQVDAQSVMASSIDAPWPTRGEEFDSFPLDALAQKIGLRKVAFLKMDTEGMELEVFAGGANTLQVTRQVALETHGETNHKESVQILSGAGFRITTDSFNGKTGLVCAARP